MKEIRQMIDMLRPDALLCMLAVSIKVLMSILCMYSIHGYQSHCNEREKQPKGLHIRQNKERINNRKREEKNKEREEREGKRNGTVSISGQAAKTMHNKQRYSSL
jgi:hypothetical protein